MTAEAAELTEFVAALPADVLAHLTWLARERERREERGEVDWARNEERRLSEQARVARVAEAMVLEDRFPAQLVIDVLVAERPAHEAVIRAVVAEALAADEVAA